jgi:hypothetical protein
VADVPAAVEAELARLRAENARLLKLLGLTPQQAASLAPGQLASSRHRRSGASPVVAGGEVAFFGTLLRSDGCVRD